MFLNNKSNLAPDGANAWLLEPPPNLFYGVDLECTFQPIDLRHDQLPAILYYTETDPPKKLLPPLLHYGYPIPGESSLPEYLCRVEERAGLKEGTLNHVWVHGCDGDVVITFGNNYEAPDLDMVELIRGDLGRDDEPKWYLSYFEGCWSTEARIMAFE